MHTHSLKDVFENSFARWSEKSAITFFRHADMETKLTYGQLEQDANRLAHTFQALGVKKVDRVIIFMGRSLVTVIALSRSKSWGPWQFS